MSKILPFARRTSWALEPNTLSIELKRLRDQKVSILDLTESNPTQCGFMYLRNNILQALALDENLKYSPMPRGNRNVREAISGYYRERGHCVVPEQIFLTASTSEAYSYLMRLLVNPGEKILFPIPSYPLFSYLGDLNDVCMETYALISEKRWAVDFDSIVNKVDLDTKALVLVNPNNPTGTFIGLQEKDKINSICREQNMALICDEVFFDFTFDADKKFISFVENKSVLTFVLGGISKLLGLPQMKLSWIIMDGPRELINQASARLEVIADTYLSVNTPVQNAFLGWIKYRRKFQAEILERIRKNYEVLRGFAKRTDHCTVLDAQGGWYAVLMITGTLSDEQLALQYLREDHVLIHPGYFFDFDYGTYLIVSLLPREHDFQEGIRRIINRLK